MKKPVIAIIIILVILFIIGGVVFLMTQGKKSITEEQFVEIAKEKEYNIGDVQNDTLENTDIQSAKIAVSNDYRYLIEFYTLKDKEAASKFFAESKASFENIKQEGDVPVEESKRNYEKYELKSDGRYFYIARIENTVLQLNVNEQEETAVTELIKALGY